MKKICIIALSVLLFLPTVSAKETPEERAQKDYSTWLPAKGDFSVGFGLDPISTFVGNLFSGATATNKLADLAGDPMGTAGFPPAAMPTPFVSLMGSYMLTDNWELKANLGFGFVYKNENFYAVDDRALALDPMSDAKVTDNAKTENYSGSISVGAHYRVGKTRCVQGIFGAGLLYAFGQASNKYTYGNAFSELNTAPTIAAGTGATYATGKSPAFDNLRPLSTTAAAMHRLGAYGTMGVEIFVAPKVALGANVNLYLFYDFTPKIDTKYEGWNKSHAAVEQYLEKVEPAKHGITFSSNNIGANLYAAFYL